MNPEDMKDVFTKLDDFRRPPSNPLMKLLVTGVLSYEGEKWAKHRKIINPTFHVEKLKVLQRIICTCFTFSFILVEIICNYIDLIRSYISK